MKFQRRWHQGLAFLLAYTLSEAKTNAGDSLSGGSVGNLRGPDLVGWSLERGHPPGGLPHQARAGVQRQLRSAGEGHPPGRLARELGADALQRSASDGQLRGGDQAPARAATRSSSAIRMKAPARSRTTTTRRRSPRRRRWRTIGQTDLSPLGGEGTQVTGPGLKQLDFGLAKSFNVWGSAAGRVPHRDVQPDQHAGVQPARLDGLSRRAELLEHHPACGTRRGRCSSA